MSKRQRQREGGVPGDIMVEILLKLPLKSLARFKSVNKEWNSSISNPRFLEDYRTCRLRGGNHHQLIFVDQRFRRMFYHDDDKKLGLYTVESRDLTANHHDQEVALTPLKVPEQHIYKDQNQYNWVSPKLLGSYNGLVAILVLSDRDCDFTLWNPLTKKHTTCAFPRISKIGHYNKMSMSLLGLCYDYSSDAYVAVVGSMYDIPSPEPPPSYVHVRFLVHTRYFNRDIHLVNFKTGAFTTLPLEGFDQISQFELEAGAGTVVCGVPHWLQLIKDFEICQGKKVIIYFSLEEKSFKHMAVHPELGPKGKTMLGLGSLDGERQLSVVLQDMTDSEFQVWVMKEYGNVESWTNLFVIQVSTIMQSLVTNQLVTTVCSMGVLGIMENGEYLINVNGMELWGYDPKTGYSRQIRIKQCSEGGLPVFTIIANEPSLISPPQTRP